jgi:hypothetical protein
MLLSAAVVGCFRGTLSTTVATSVATACGVVLVCASNNVANESKLRAVTAEVRIIFISMRDLHFQIPIRWLRAN